MDWRGDEELSKEEGTSHISPLSPFKGFRIYRILVHSLFWIIAKLTCPIDRRATFAEMMLYAELIQQSAGEMPHHGSRDVSRV